jgi:hypothetical protein
MDELQHQVWWASIACLLQAWTWVSRRARFRPAAAARQSSQPQPRPTVAVHAPTASPRSSTAQQPAMPVSATQTTRLPPQPQRQTVNVSSEQRAIGQGRTTGQHTQVGGATSTSMQVDECYW